MIKKICIVLLFLATVAGCATVEQPEPKVIKETVYIIKTPDAQLMTLPSPVQDIDVDTATQFEVSEWILNKEAYTILLENKLIELANFFASSKKDITIEKPSE